MTRLPTARHLLALLSLTVLVALASACGRSDLLSYADFADAGPDGSQGAPDGSHPHRQGGCTSSDDCATTPKTPYCELPQGACVACLTDPDTCPPGEACSAATHTCIGISTGCKSNASCPATKPICDVSTGQCVGCTSSNQCPTGEICKDDQCVASCGGGAACGEGLACCAGGCIDEGTDPDDCGTCGRACPSGQACVGGACQPPTGCTATTGCTGGDVCCGAACVNTEVNPADCGSCGKVCPAGDSCASGTCQAPVSCNGGPVCTGSDQCCAAGCADTTSDPDNCGGCGRVCGAGTTCMASLCVSTAKTCRGGPACSGVDQCCENGCTDPSTDPNNCSKCGVVCAAGDTCVAGACTAPASCNGGPVCIGKDQCCSVGCVDIDTDPNHCGGCNHACPAGDTCVGATCTAPASCNGGPLCTGVDQCCTNGCTDIDTDPNNCGGCGQPCPSGDTCVGALCQAPTTCNGGPTCTGVDQCCTSGCTDIDTDPKNCGGCGRPCPAGDTCVAAQCQAPASCNGGPVCTGVNQCCTSGCTDIDTDPANCGGCNQPCPAGDTCVAAQCVAPASCNGGPVCMFKEQCCADGCTDIDTDPQNCGGCNQPCPAGDTCVAAMCTAPASCNGGPVCTGADQCCASGCVDIDTDPANCGGCNQPCPPPGVCMGGGCATTGCDLTCPPIDTCCTSGCTDTTSDPLNCGGCDQPCPAGEACVASTCQVPASCNGGPACPVVDQCCPTGCVNTTSDPLNCGGCDQPCPAGQACVASTCQLSASCNGGPACPVVDQCCATGCTDTTSDPLNCGGCSLPCPTGSPCVGSVCQPAETCNGGPACPVTPPTEQCCPEGCTDTSSDPANCGGCNQPCPLGFSCVSSSCQPPVGCGDAAACSATQTCCPSGCTDTTSDPANCNGCNVACPPGDTCVASTCTAPGSCNGGPACPGAESCCSSGCSDTSSDPLNCGGCGMPCPMVGDTCVNSMCVSNEGVFSPTVNPTFLSPGSHAYTSINIPAGVTVFVAGGGTGSGTLSLSATGTVEIDGVIDVSGGPGTQNTITSQNSEAGEAGGGGFTGEPYQSAAFSTACSFVAGNGGSLGDAISGTVGTCFQASTSVCLSQTDANALVFAAPPATFGGGGGVFTGFRAYGGGGGGPAGGAPGALGAPFPGESDCSGASGGGGAVAGQGGAAPGPYAGTAGVVGETQCPALDAGEQDAQPAFVGGGGGGSIGAAAAADLAVVSTFQTGSGGGGGSADYLDRPVFGGTSGGGGGGGALMISSQTSITITGQVRANGGVGGDAVLGIGEDAMCNPQPGAAGGGGSGGLIYLQAPTVSVVAGATVSAVGGNGGAASEFATGGGGGNGGLGRIRLSVTAPDCSSLAGSFNPPLPPGCTAGAAQSGTTFIGTYPN